jgi:hypothetical protein
VLFLFLFINILALKRKSREMLVNFESTFRMGDDGLKIFVGYIHIYVTALGRQKEGY